MATALPIHSNAGPTAGRLPRFRRVGLAGREVVVLSRELLSGALGLLSYIPQIDLKKNFYLWRPIYPGRYASASPYMLMTCKVELGFLRLRRTVPGGTTKNYGFRKTASAGRHLKTPGASCKILASQTRTVQ